MSFSRSSKDKASDQVTGSSRRLRPALKSPFMSFHFQIFTVLNQQERRWLLAKQRSKSRGSLCLFRFFLFFFEEVHQRAAFGSIWTRGFSWGTQVGPLSTRVSPPGVRGRRGGGVKRATSKLENKNQIGISLSH